ncbi:MAG: hypothetical protein ACI84D_001998 [Thalassolituus oleivorans]|jgi:hypothetical protein
MSDPRRDAHQFGRPSAQPPRTLKSRKARISLFVLAILLGVIATGPSGALGALLSVLSPGSGSADSVEATGSASSGPLEEFVEITWHVDAPIGVTDFFEITRGTTLLHVAASTESLFEDRSAVPAITYVYCVDLVSAANVKTRIGCAAGSRVIAQPTGFEATDGSSEEYVGLTWSDQSAIETGYNLYREGGKALKLDGTGGYVQIEDISLQGSFTIELWASRAMGSTDDVLFKLETPEGQNRSDPPFEISFDNTNALTALYGFEEMKLPAAVSDIDWHHWAVAFDQDSKRWYFYRDGVLVAEEALSVDFLSRGPLLIGRRVFDQNAFRVATAGRGYFDGAVDEIRLWNIALTEEQVASRMLTMLSGLESGLVNYWSMDDSATLVVRDLVGGSPGSIRQQSPTASAIASGLPSFRNTIGANLTNFADRLAIPGFGDANGDGAHTPDEPIYTYTVKAFVDVNGDGEFSPGVDYESDPRTDEGWRAVVRPPGSVMATDGQFGDRVRVTWLDLTSSEDGYRIYRDGIALTTTLPDVVLYDDLGAIGQQEYCVAAFAGGVESTRRCDYGRMDLLAPPADVTATYDDHDDRVVVAWNDTTSTEDGFEVYRDTQLRVTLGADVQEYSDLSALQDVEYDYCVVAISRADPLSVVRSGQTCAPTKGRRAAILAPTGLTASQAEFEDRVELKWLNPSTTALLFKVFRGNQVIEILDFNTTTATDFEIGSDVDIGYTVIGVTVVQPSARQQQGQVAQVLESIRTANLVAASTGGEIISAEETLTEVYRELGLDAEGKAGFGPGGLGTNLGATVSGVVESDPISASGRRSINAPTGLETTPNEFENHVQLDWTDNSSVETNYRIYRTPLDALGAPTGPEVLVETLSANRTTYGDYTGEPGVPFGYRIEAIDAYGVSASASKLGIRTLLPPTQFLASKGVTEEIVFLDWADNSAAEDGYNVYRRIAIVPPTPVPAWGAPIFQTGKNEPAHEDTLPIGLRGLDLEYRVAAFDAYGESLSVPPDTGYTMIEAPGDVSASDTYPLQVVVVWTDRSSVEDGYEVTRRAVGAPVSSAILSTAWTVPQGPLPANSTRIVDTPGAGRFVYCVRSTRGGEKSDETCDQGEYSGALAGPGVVPGGIHPFRIDRDTLSNFQGANNIKFGSSVGADAAGSAIIGAPGGSNSGAAVEYNIDGNNDWTIQKTITRPPSTRFGGSVDVNGAFVSVGADDGFFLFNKGTGTLNTGTATAGPTIANVDDWYVAGNPAAAASMGTAVVCKGGFACVTLPVGLPAGAPSLVAGEEFGAAVDITKVKRTWDNLFVEPDPVPSDNVTYTDREFLVAVVGAPGGGKDKSRALVFECALTGPGADATDPCTMAADWKLAAEVKGQFSKLAGTGFGEAVSVSADHVVVGDGASNGFEVWDRADPVDPATGIGIWVQAVIVQAPDDSAREISKYGSAVSISADDILIGAPQTNHNEPGFTNSGVLFVYSLVSLKGGDKNPRLKYDARTGGSLQSQALFGSSVAIGDDFYLVGAPGESDGGAAYSIPFNYEPVVATSTPEDAVLTAATGVSASNGSAPDRIQVKWTDNAENENGQIIYRSREGGTYDRLAEIPADIVFYDDFSAAPGDAYTYCVTAFTAAGGEIQESEKACDIGWRPANGTIAGVIAAAAGGGTEGVDVCLSPSPNRALLLDGAGGHLTAVPSLARGTANETTSGTQTQLDVAGWTVSAAKGSTLFIEDTAGIKKSLVLTKEAPKGSTTISFAAVDLNVTPGAPIFDKSDVEMPENFTIEAWIRQQGTGAGEQFVAVRDKAFALSIVNDDGMGGDVWITTWENSATPVQTFMADTNLPVGAWHHIAVTRSLDKRTTVYAQGVEVAFEQRVLLLDTAQAGDTLRIGRHGLESQPATSPTGPDGYFRGEIDELRFWSLAKTETEIASAFRTPLSGEEEGLVGYWPLDQGDRLVAPDISVSAVHANFSGGAYIADIGAPIEVCGVTDSEGQYSIPQIRYGETTEFKVTPSMDTREFEPGFQKITLAADNPVQNQLFFVDATSFTVAGVAQYTDAAPNAFTCPAPNAGIHVSKDGVVLEANLKATTSADGSFVIALDPSEDAADPWFLTPKFATQVDADGNTSVAVHSYAPSQVELVLKDDTFDLVFEDAYRNTLSGAFSGGDPLICQKDVGIAEIRIYTEDGCFDRTVQVNSQPVGAGDFNIAFSLDLPPLKYLVEVVNVKDATGATLTDVEDFFKALGTYEVDLTQGDAERDFVYRAPITLSIAGLEPAPVCDIPGLTQFDDGELIRTLQNVATLEQFEFREVTLSVTENYGAAGVCPVDVGTLTIFDAISDKVDRPVTLQLENGEAKYTLVGTSPNIFSGARIGGVDRSFQKPITVVAQVEGIPSITTTEWAMVQGFRERSATFVSATTEEFPLLILHDPPGSNSYAFIEKGTQVCNTITNTQIRGGSLGLDTEIYLGFVGNILTAPFGIGASTEIKAGVKWNIGVHGGFEVNELQQGKPNRSICMTATETITTSSDMTWVGEDIHMGVALNLIFAIADVLEIDDSDVCKFSMSEQLAADINEATPFETTYTYGTSHIGLSLIPELENLIELAGGDAAITGQLEGDETTIRLVDALDNWKAQLSNSADLQAQALENYEINRSFSGGTDFQYVETADTTTVTYTDNLTTFFDLGQAIGPFAGAAGPESTIQVAIEGHRSWTSEEDSTTASSSSVGYVLSDGDTGDYFSVDVAKNPRYGTFVFGTRSGRSSNPWEGNTQKRDNPIIMVDPPVLHNVPEDGWGSFELTLINGSESNERRQYVLNIPGELNKRNLGVTVTGDLLGGERLESFLLDPGKAITINMDVARAASATSYPNVGVMLYPAIEYQIWQADHRQAFALSDTAFFSVYFDSSATGSLSSRLAEGWNWFSINRPGGDVDEVMGDFKVNHGDLIADRSEEARYDSTLGWTGTLTRVIPGAGYQLRLQEPGLFHMSGEPFVVTEPTELSPGWSWIGYLPNQSMPVADALSSLSDRLIDGDAVVSQHGFAQFVKGVGWVGTLRDMEPGKAYQLYLSGGGSLLYPEAPEVAALRDPEVRTTTVSGPAWEVNAEEYSASMVIVAEVAMLGAPLAQTTTKVAVTSGEDVRGIADVRWVESLKRHLAFIQVYGDYEADDLFKVHAYNGESRVLYEDVASVRFEAQTILGSASAPVALELTEAGQAPELLDVPAEFALYPNFPNPFNPQTMIAYDLPETGQVTLRVYDVIGRLVTTLVNSDQTPGRYSVVFDAQDYASGLYLYRLTYGAKVAMGKMLLVK